MARKDLILKMVIQDEELKTRFNLDGTKCTTIHEALESDKPVIRTIAKIIDNISEEHTQDKSVYNEIINDLIKHHAN
jgi:hypothetical protein